eukprot:TRINITY_DN28337_c0_g1_i1.p1 TRINITY_DN28337_c0_g1~~TRINITY_DN28337_c0_g1_i1.p1  ORF type:complete len:407 (+),score=33.33 TRINITY_DN28337_c0_g1_i1:23-1243(+)
MLTFCVDGRSVRGAPLVREVLLSEKQNGLWQECDAIRPGQWNLWWRTCRFSPFHLRQAKPPHQRVNHFNGTQHLTMKNLLASNLQALQKKVDTIQVVPHTWTLPEDYSAWKKECEEHKERLWIVKPADSSRGRGIVICTSAECEQHDPQLQDNTAENNEVDSTVKKTGTMPAKTVVQHYIDKPMLLRGYKFDLRVYVLVESFQPLRVYVYQDAIVRVASKKYTQQENIADVYQHLTNVSINKHNQEGSLREGIGEGCKFVLHDFQEDFNTAIGPNGFDRMWSAVQGQVVVSCLSMAHKVEQHAACFELFGYDFLLDEHGFPWLLEVNFSPAMDCDTPADSFVKPQLIAETVAVLGIVPFVGTASPGEVKRLKLVYPVGGLDQPQEPLEQAVRAAQESYLAAAPNSQ